MATILSANHMNLLDLLKSEGYDGDKEMVLGELLLNDSFMMNCPWSPTSDGLLHKGIKASELGKGSNLRINQGYSTIRSDSKQFSKQTSSFGAISQVDDLLLRSGTPEQRYKARLLQDTLNQEGFMQSYVDKMFYGKASDDADGFDGLATIVGKKSSKYFYDGGVTSGDTSSIYLVEFGRRGLTLRYPSAGQSSFQMRDEGKIKEKIDSKHHIFYWNTVFEITSLIDIFDDRAFLRYGNLNPEGTNNAIDPKTFIKMRNALPSVGRNAAAFVNRSLKTQFEVNLLDKNNVNYTRRDIENYGEVVRFMGVDILLQDSIRDNEKVVA